MEQKNSKNILYLHIAVMLFSVSGVIGQFVEVPSVLVAMGRVICSSIILFTIAKVKKNNLALESKKDYALIIFTGMVLAAHWTTFFQSIQVSTVAIGTITFSTLVVGLWEMPSTKNFLLKTTLKKLTSASSVAWTRAQPLTPTAD